VTVTQHTKHPEIDAVRAGASTIGRVIWTLFAFLVVLIGWSAATKALLDIHQAWAYALFAVATLLFIAVIAGLRTVWRDSRYW
jgi:hypothetical protein